MKKKLLFFLLVMLVLTAANAQIVSYQYDENGNRDTREVIVLNSKTSTSSFINDSTKAQNDIFFTKDNIKIHPNPTRGNLFVEITSDLEIENALILVSDMKGNILYRNSDISSKYNINLSHVPAGVYTLTIKSSNKKYDWKIIKQ